MKNYELSIKVQRAIDFLNNHPGVGATGDFLRDNFIWFMVDVCKNGEFKDNRQKPEDVTVRLYKRNVYRDKEKGEILSAKFNDFFNEYKDEDDDDEIDVPYREVYGYEWEYDHTYYVGEYCFLKFHPDEDYIKYLKEFKNVKDEQIHIFIDNEVRFYNRYQGGYIRAESFEDLIIKVAEDVKEKYGDFDYNSFVKDEEKNPPGAWPFHFEPLNDGSGCSRMIKNEDYITVRESTKNLRWYEWFKTTDYYKEHWE